MIVCPNCNKELSDGAKFCGRCGTRITEEIIAASMAKEEIVSEETPVSVEVAEKEVLSTPKTKKERFKEALISQMPFDFRRRKVQIWSGVVAVALILVMVLSVVFSYLGRNNYVLYLKDDELMYSSLTSIKPVEVTEDSTTYHAAYYTMLSKDETKIFYLDDIYDDGGKLYYREVKKPDKDPVKIDSNVTSFMINEKGNRVTYLKEGKLYQHNLKEKDKLASNVEGFQASKDGKIVVWLDSDDKAYIMKIGKDKEKIDSNISEILYVTEDCKTVWYMRDDILYKKEIGKDKQKVAGDVARVVHIYDSGKAYFLKEETKNLMLQDYVVDDKKETDALMQEPIYPSLSDYLNLYDTYEEAYEAYDQACDAYYDARNEWWDKEDRDYLREQLETASYEYQVYNLYYYNGKQVQTVSKEVSRNTMDYAMDKAVISYGVTRRVNSEKMTLSEINYIYEIRYMIEEMLEQPGDFYIAIGAKTTNTGIDNAGDCAIAADGSMAYILNDMDYDTQEGTLYQVVISKDKVKKATKVASDVYAYGIIFVGGDKLAYLKQVKNECGDLYVGKKKVDSGVVEYSATYYKELKAILYKTDWDDEDDSYTLMQYKDGKVTEIAEDVASFAVTPNGYIAYLCDYNQNRDEGDLYLYNKRKSKLIDDEVTCILPVRRWED